MFGLEYEDEKYYHEKAAMIILFQGLPIFLILHFILPSPWGKTITYSLGPVIPARISWFIFEIPNLIWCIICIISSYNNNNYYIPKMNIFLLCLFIAHYINRALIYPLFMSKNTTHIPLLVVIVAFCFCITNGYVQAQGLCRFVTLPTDWHWHPQFFIGFTMFVVGATINITSDMKLRHLRTLSSNRRQIPTGGLFDYISTPHYFGEIIEWFGYSIACNFSLPSIAFFIYTASNLIPRGIAHHIWYKTNFKSYPSHRKAIFPFIW